MRTLTLASILVALPDDSSGGILRPRVEGGMNVKYAIGAGNFDLGPGSARRLALSLGSIVFGPVWLDTRGAPALQRGFHLALTGPQHQGPRDGAEMLELLRRRGRGQANSAN